MSVQKKRMQGAILGIPLQLKSFSHSKRYGLFVLLLFHSAMVICSSSEIVKFSGTDKHYLFLKFLCLINTDINSRINIKNMKGRSLSPRSRKSDKAIYKTRTTPKNRFKALCIKITPYFYYMAFIKNLYHFNHISLAFQL